MSDFQAMTAAEIEAFAIAHSDEIGCGGLEPGDVTQAIADGRAVLEARAFGFALIQLSPAYQAAGHVPHLWLLYVAPEMRGRGFGRRFVRELLRRYEVDYSMTLTCVGPARRRFFGRLGFVVEGRDGEYRRMTRSNWRGGLPASR